MITFRSVSFEFYGILWTCTVKEGIIVYVVNIETNLDWPMSTTSTKIWSFISFDC